MKKQIFFDTFKLISFRNEKNIKQFITYEDYIHDQYFKTIKFKDQVIKILGLLDDEEKLGLTSKKLDSINKNKYSFIIYQIFNS